MTNQALAFPSVSIFLARLLSSRQVAPCLIISVAIILWSAFLYVLAMYRFNAFVGTMGDMGNTENILWNTINGEPFRLSTLKVSWLGQHFAPGILLWAPFYALWPDPRCVLLLQAITIALGALPVYLL